METRITTIIPTATNEPIPGYVLQRRLGSGGYGEVWEAEAPGGLKKAVKFVYGALEEARAQRELKSLNRIKEVHHPFLLSLERIEVVDGRLMIVTELAKCCLRARYEECRQKELDGIPRDELLGYLRDAADALDFIHEHHQLQHLDVKPENLLIVGNHVKVADFGLLKDLREAASLLGGMTPLYCPPEVFDGRPGLHSDQYSLAVVYQELLTGKPPFGGRTTAQLAAQHLHSPPMTAVLPISDQPAVLRALSKNPGSRFPNCRAFVEAVLHPESGFQHKRMRSRLRVSAAKEPVARTEVLGGGEKSSPSDHQTSSKLSRPAAEVRQLPPLKLSAAELPYRPTVIIGIGGAAGRVMCHLRSRIHDQFGSVANLPALQMLLLDTDAKALAAAMFKRGNGVIPGKNTLAIPLRPTKDYRSDSRSILEWLSRRWLYNIPRSLQTEGLRPLGRLAFVDHAQRIFEQIEKTILAATDTAAIEASAAMSGLPFKVGPPRIFVISAISGGTGSGAVIDLGYAVRKLLADLKLPDQGVCGLLLHATPAAAERIDLANANALATLTELLQFSTEGSYYPGDPACNLPLFDAPSAPFHETYVVHLGDAQLESGFRHSVAAIADYLFENTLSPGAAFFDAARRPETSAGTRLPIADGLLRTFGIVRHNPFEDEPAFLKSDAPPSRQLSSRQFDEDGEQVTRDSFVPSDGLWHPRTKTDAATQPATDTQMNVGETREMASPDWWQERNWNRAVPALAVAGGARRLYIAAASDVDRERLAQRVGNVSCDSVTFVESHSRDITACHEFQEMPADNVLAAIAGHRHDLYEIASRLHTRIDVEWQQFD